jgi:hypothetical protein
MIRLCVSLALSLILFGCGEKASLMELESKKSILEKQETELVSQLEKKRRESRDSLSRGAFEKEIFEKEISIKSIGSEIRNLCILIAKEKALKLNIDSDFQSFREATYPYVQCPDENRHFRKVYHHTKEKIYKEFNIDPIKVSTFINPFGVHLHLYGDWRKELHAFLFSKNRDYGLDVDSEKFTKNIKENANLFSEDGNLTVEAVKKWKYSSGQI